MRKSVLFALLVASGAARAADQSGLSVGDVTSRETFLSISIAVMIALGLSSFFLAGRIAERTHVAIALLSVFVGAFCIFMTYGLADREYPIIGGLVAIGLISLFKLMNQIEVRRRHGDGSRNG